MLILKDWSTELLATSPLQVQPANYHHVHGTICIWKLCGGSALLRHQWVHLLKQESSDNRYVLQQTDLAHCTGCCPALGKKSFAQIIHPVFLQPCDTNHFLLLRGVDNFHKPCMHCGFLMLLKRTELSPQFPDWLRSTAQLDQQEPRTILTDLSYMMTC